MCGRYTLTQMGVIEDRFRIDESRMAKLEALFNIAPTEPAPVVIEEEGRRVLLPMNFGLIPSWSKTGKLEMSTINARAESVDEKPAFREPLKRRRCLVPADGYFEWKAAGKARLPYRITMKDGGPFALAGLWDVWKGPDGREIRSFTIITTESNGLTREFHDRMPVILAPENEPLWISGHVSENRTLLPLLKPYPPQEMTLYPVRTAVNSARNKGPDCIAPAPPPDPDLFG